MCGLFGAVFTDGDTRIDPGMVEASLRSLSHRGPDSCDTVILPGSVLGHTRLSFLDLSEHGRQPFVDASGRYVLVYNGEIYNFRQIRAELERKGCKFHSDSDTEVLLYGLIVFGESILPRLEGMFSFALFDRETREILVGRDRFGIKPFFYAETAEGFFFASEIKALRGWVPLQPNDMTVAGYLSGHYLQTSGHSLVRGIEFFPSGHVGRFVPGVGLEVRPFYEVVDFFDEGYRAELSAKNESALIDMCDEFLNESVRKHMIADVPVGALCSGGVDSSLILAMATKHTSNLRIFHSNVVGPHSETDAARLLARHLNLELAVAECHDDDFISLMPDVIKHFEAPFLYHPNSVPFLQVAMLVRDSGVKAVLTGEGADEALLGYADLPLASAISRYHARLNKMRSFVHRIPWVGEILWRSPASKNMGVRFASGMDSETPVEWVNKLKKVGVDESDAEEALPLLSYHLRTLLMRNDRLGMAASLEARFPFLDHDFMRFAVNLPRRMKIHPSRQAYGEVRHPFFMTKWILREVAKRYLPPELSWRRKRGFPTNAFDYINVPAGYFFGSWLQHYMKISREKMSTVIDNLSREERLRLLMLNMWGELLIENESVSVVRDRINGSVSVSR